MLDESFIIECENELKDKFNELDNICRLNSKKVLDAFHKYKVSESDLNGTTGYGYNDEGRSKIEKIFAYIFDAESALVRSQFISGSHAITVSLFALLRPNDKLLTITGLPYDTLHEVIGIKDNNSSLKSYGIKYDYIDLKDNDFDYEKIKSELKKDVKVIHIQRSRGYSLRESISIGKLARVIKFIKNINKDIIIFVDNCYCELVENISPISVGADICAGSLIKNMGAGIALNGGYIVGKEKLINLCAQRLTLPGEGSEVGPSNDANRRFLQGLFLSPSAVNSALKTSLLASLAFEKLGYKVSPRYIDERCDIVELIYLKNKEEMIKFSEAIQSSGPIDSHVKPVPEKMPGYDDEIIMASSSFVQGSTIELSCDGPIRKPYVIFLQGSLTYEYGRIAILNTINKLKE